MGDMGGREWVSGGPNTVYLHRDFSVSMTMYLCDLSTIGLSGLLSIAGCSMDKLAASMRSWIQMLERSGYTRVVGTMDTGGHSVQT